MTPKRNIKAAFPAVPREKLGFDPATNASAAASAYIAQENMILYRMRYPDGSYREFEHNFDNPDVLRSTGGWHGRVKGDRITIKPAIPTDWDSFSIRYRHGSSTYIFHYRRDNTHAPAEPLSIDLVDDHQEHIVIIH